MKVRRPAAFLLVFLLLGCARPAAAATGDPDALAPGKIAYANGDHNRAIQEFRKVLHEHPNDAEAYLWLGRALGRKADKSNPFHAMFMVGEIKGAFEHAVALAPDHWDAHQDLLEFYLNAPGAFGGGLDKARKQAEILARLSAAEGHVAASRIAEKHRDYALTEKELQAALAADPKNLGRYRELGHFYHRRRRWAEMEEAFRKAGDRKANYHLAAGYLEQGVKLEEAERLLKLFLSAPQPPPGDEPTLAQALLMMGQVKARLGRTEEAAHEYRSALAKNPFLHEARKELERLSIVPR